MSRDLGQRQDVEHRVYQPFSDPPVLFAATVALTVTKPDATTSTPSISNPSTGIYQASFTLDQTGTWRWHWAISGTVVDEADGEVAVFDPQPPSYATLTQLKAMRTIDNATDRDEDLTRKLATASRQIDKTTGERQFWLDKTASARIYRTRDRVVCTEEGEWLTVDDIGTLTGLVVEVGDGTNWTAVTDYQTGPENALAKRKPINRLLRPSSYWTRMWGTNTQIRVTARWGWPAVPDEVVEATLIQANRLYMRKDSPEGVLGSAEWGVVRVGKVDPDVQELIKDLCLMGV